MKSTVTVNYTTACPVATDKFQNHRFATAQSTTCMLCGWGLDQIFAKMEVDPNALDQARRSKG